MRDVEGRVACVTGGASGIGYGIAEAFLEAGMNVVITARTESRLREAHALLEAQGHPGRVHAICVDVMDRPGMERAAAETVETFGKVHVVVNNAGVQDNRGMLEMSYEDWDYLIGINITGVYNGVRAFVPHIKEHGEGGHVLTTASILGLFVGGGSGYGAYSTSKFAMVGMMEALRSELAPFDIGVSAFCPGLVKSNLEPGIIESPAAADPLEIGRLVLQGVRNNDLYIITHPEFEPVWQSRYELLEASVPRDLGVPDERQLAGAWVLESSYYADDLARRQRV